MISVMGVFLSRDVVAGALSAYLGVRGFVLNFTGKALLVHAFTLILPDVVYVIAGYSSYKITKYNAYRDLHRENRE